MKKTIAINTISNLLICIAYVIFWYAKFVKLNRYNYIENMLGLIIPVVIVGVALYLADISNRKINIIFFVFNLIVVFLYFTKLYQIDLIMYVSIPVCIMYLFGAIKPKTTS